MYFIFRTIMIGVLLVVKTRFTAKRLFQGKSISKIKERKRIVWIHAASVGELNLIDSTIRFILRESDNSVLLTMFTDTGMEAALKKYGESGRIKMLYFPLDSKRVIRKILDKIELAKLVLVETEIWPNLIKLCSKKSEVVIVNGRISDKSLPRYKQIKFLIKPILNRIGLFLMQTEKDKERIIEIGAERDRCVVTGNLKFDTPYQQISNHDILTIKSKYGIKDKKVIVAGSTHPGEEEFWIEKIKKMENTLLFIVPRHINRVPDIERDVLKNTSYVKWSGTPKGGESIVLVDAMGVLKKLYALCDYAFVGGTLVNVGGHSLLEPLSYGKIPLFGKYYQNTKEIGEEVLKRGIGVLIGENDDITEQLKRTEIDKTSEITAYFDENKNVLDKNMKYILT